jgi:dolichol-phosphate mannosyltransferase
MNRLHIVIPAYNEEANIEKVVREWHRVVESLGDDGSKLVIIDDGSRDSTFEILNQLTSELKCLHPIRKENSGHGATVLFGYRWALQDGADFIFQTDSDGQTIPEEFTNFWALRNDYDAIVGHRKHRQDGFSRILVTKTLKMVLLLTFGVRVIDANTPFRLMKRDLIEKYIGRIPDGFNLTNVLLTVAFIRNKEKVRFLPITFRPRQGGVNSINLKKITRIGIRAVRDFRIIRKQSQL